MAAIPYRDRKVPYERAIKILDLILSGECDKRIVHELKVARTDITMTRHMFPLFTGLVQKRKNNV